MRQAKNMDCMGKDVKQKTVECSDQPHYLSGFSGLSIYNVNPRLVGKSKLIVSKFLPVHVVIFSVLQKKNKCPTGSIPEEP